MRNLCAPLHERLRQNVECRDTTPRGPTALSEPEESEGKSKGKPLVGFMR